MVAIGLMKLQALVPNMMPVAIATAANLRFSNFLSPEVTPTLPVYPWNKR
jgi:hypothetical protein